MLTLGNLDSLSDPVGCFIEPSSRSSVTPKIFTNKKRSVQVTQIFIVAIGICNHIMNKNENDNNIKKNSPSSNNS